MAVVSVSAGQTTWIYRTLQRWRHRHDGIGGQCEVYTLSEEIQQLRPEGSCVGDGFPEKTKQKKRKRQGSGAGQAGRPASEESRLGC